jgi:hypothetical protein
MSGTSILQETFPTNKDNRIGEIKYRISFLRVTFGDILNRWPKYAQTEYFNLARELRQLEFGGRS